MKFPVPTKHYVQVLSRSQKAPRFFAMRGTHMRSRGTTQDATIQLLLLAAVAVVTCVNGAMPSDMSEQERNTLLDRMVGLQNEATILENKATALRREAMAIENRADVYQQRGMAADERAGKIGANLDGKPFMKPIFPKTQALPVVADDVRMLLSPRGPAGTADSHTVRTAFLHGFHAGQKECKQEGYSPCTAPKSTSENVTTGETDRKQLIKKLNTSELDTMNGSKNMQKVKEALAICKPHERLCPMQNFANGVLAYAYCRSLPNVLSFFRIALFLVCL